MENVVVQVGEQRATVAPDGITYEKYAASRHAGFRWVPLGEGEQPGDELRMHARVALDMRQKGFCRICPACGEPYSDKCGCGCHWGDECPCCKRPFPHA
jgi:hypothetical protein